VSGAERAARRTVAVAAAGDFQAEREAHSAGGPAPDWQTWALRLAGAVDLIATGPADDGEDLDDGDGTEPYCRTCGEWAGLFIGMDGWRHFRGDPEPGGQRELYDAGHEPVIGWTRPPGAALSPAGHRLLLAALADAASFRMEQAGAYCLDCATSDDDLCAEHAAEVGHADAYRVLACLLGSQP